VANASVVDCADTGSGLCESTETASDGSYAFTVSPGTDTVTASASGYLATSTTVGVLSGLTVTVPGIYLPWGGPGQAFEVQGYVGSGANGSTPVGHASVSGYQRGQLVAGTTTGANGRFELWLDWGSYTVVVTAPGYEEARGPLSVYGSVSSVDLVLSPFPWTVTGHVENTFDGAGVPGAEVWIGGEVRATADGSGAFTLELANGTYAVTVEAGAANPGLFSTVKESVEVEGASVGLTVGLPLAAMPVALTALDGRSGMNLVGATLTVNGTLEIRGTYNGTWSSGSNGWVSVELPLGEFTLTGSAAGYGTERTTFTVENGSVTVNVTLPKLEGVSSTEVPWLTVGLGFLLVAAVAVVAFGYWQRRKGARLARPEVSSTGATQWLSEEGDGSLGGEEQEGSSLSGSRR
jgi:hypothetical protein